jgi:hypothetical protein
VDFFPIGAATGVGLLHEVPQGLFADYGVNDLVNLGLGVRKGGLR